MMLATIIGTKDGSKWESLDAGTASKVLPNYRSGAFKGFRQVVYMDWRGTRKRRKGLPAAPPAPKKPKAKTKAA